MPSRANSTSTSHIDWHHDEHLLSIAFPLDVRADTAACDVQFGVTHRPTHPSSPWDAAKFEVCAHRYVSLAEPSFGVAVLNDGRYGHARLRRGDPRQPRPRREVPRSRRRPRPPPGEARDPAARRRPGRRTCRSRAAQPTARVSAGRHRCRPAAIAHCRGTDRLDRRVATASRCSASKSTRSSCADDEPSSSAVAT